MVPFIIIPIFILLILPSIAILSEIYYIEYNIYSIYPIQYSFFGYLTIIIVLIYALTPLLSASKIRSGRGGGVKFLVIEFEFLKKLVYVGIPLLIFVMLIFLHTYQPERLNSSYALFGWLIIIVGGALLRIIVCVIRKDFRFYYAKGCLDLLFADKEETQKVNYLNRSLNSYNKYLRRNLKLQIDNIQVICSKVISETFFRENEHEFIKSLSRAFESDYKLGPAKQILHFAKVENTERFLTKEPLWEKIKDWGAFLAAVIPVIISIITSISAR